MSLTIDQEVRGLIFYRFQIRRPLANLLGSVDKFGQDKTSLRACAPKQSQFRERTSYLRAVQGAPHCHGAF